MERSLDKLERQGIRRIIIVTGHLNHFYDDLAQRRPRVETVHNPAYASTGSMASLAVAAPLVDEPFLLLESDLIYEERGLRLLQETALEDAVLVSGFTRSGDEVWIETEGNRISRMSKNRADLGSVLGELSGLNKISPELLDRMVALYRESSLSQYHYEYALTDASASKPVGFVYCSDLVWAEIDDAQHLQRVENELIPRLRQLGEE
jgi:choline kinase